MAGGLGSRFGGPHKIVADVCGKPLILRVLEPSLALSRVAIVAVTRATEGIVKGVVSSYPVGVIMTDGHSYEEDLGQVLRTVRARPMLVLPADVYGISAGLVKDLYLKASEVNADVVTFKVGGSYIGVSVFKGNSTSPWRDVELNWDLININTEADLRLARARCAQATRG